MRLRKRKTGDGWDPEHWEYQCVDGKHPSFWKTVVTSPEWKAWERDVAKRLHEGAQENVWDIDESQECNWISPAHFAAFLSFIKQDVEAKCAAETARAEKAERDVAMLNTDVYRAAWKALDAIMVEAGMSNQARPEEAQTWLRDRLAEAWKADVLALFEEP